MVVIIKLPNLAIFFVGHISLYCSVAADICKIHPEWPCVFINAWIFLSIKIGHIKGSKQRKLCEGVSYKSWWPWWRIIVPCLCIIENWIENRQMFAKNWDMIVVFLMTMVTHTVVDLVCITLIELNDARFWRARPTFPELADFSRMQFPPCTVHYNV